MFLLFQGTFFTFQHLARGTHDRRSPQLQAIQYFWPLWGPHSWCVHKHTHKSLKATIKKKNNSFCVDRFRYNQIIFSWRGCGLQYAHVKTSYYHLLWRAQLSLWCRRASHPSEFKFSCLLQEDLSTCSCCLASLTLRVACNLYCKVHVNLNDLLRKECKVSISYCPWK